MNDDLYRDVDPRKVISTDVTIDNVRLRRELKQKEQEKQFWMNEFIELKKRMIASETQGIQWIPTGNEKEEGVIQQFEEYLFTDGSFNYLGYYEEGLGWVSCYGEDDYESSDITHYAIIKLPGEKKGEDS